MKATKTTRRSVKKRVRRPADVPLRELALEHVPSKPSRIVAFCCENSGYLAALPLRADKLLKSVDIVKVPCAGHVRTETLLNCLHKGARGVLVLGCPLENCKYMHGNQRALKRVQVVQQAVENAGWNRNSVRMELLSSVDPHKVLRVLKEMLA